MDSEFNLVNVYSVLTPLALILIILETSYCYLNKKNHISFSEAVTNLGTAIGNQCVNLGVAYLVLVVFGQLYEFRFYTIQTTLLSFILLLVLFDFLFYWFHRHGHSVNILWAAHMPHHSSEEFNLFVGLRASITQRIFSFTYMWPLPLLGFRPEAIYAASAVQLIIAFWHHTRVIGKMGWFETIFNSPSYHRVHHAINKKYLDKNFGEIFIIWDKLFGTCAKEDEEPVYGCLTPVRSCDPNKIYFQYWRILYEDMKNTRSWFDKIRLWFMPLGWRPEDVRNLPRFRVDEHSLERYSVPVSTRKKIYLFLQACLGLLLMKFAIDLTLDISLAGRVALIMVLWGLITNWGTVLEDSKVRPKLEALRFMVNILVTSYVFLGDMPMKLLVASVILSIILTDIVFAYITMVPDKKRGAVDLPF